MMSSKSLKLVIFFSLFSVFAFAQQGSVKIALLKYNGGGDWYANPTALPNLIEFCNDQLNMDLAPENRTVEVGSLDIFNYPFLHMTGHGNVFFSESDAKNLRNYLSAGGFLHVDDNYGLDPFIRREMKKVFPEYDFVELPFSHPIYKQVYEFKSGLPKIHVHENKPPQGFGIIHEGRLVCFYTYETDLGDGWEDAAVHNNSQATRLKALQMGANILAYCFSN